MERTTIAAAPKLKQQLPECRTAHQDTNREAETASLIKTDPQHSSKATTRKSTQQDYRGNYNTG